MDLGVDQLVDDDVVDHLGRGHDQAVGEAERAARAAGAPAGAGGGDADLLVAEGILPGQAGDTLRYVGPGLRFVPLLESAGGPRQAGAREQESAAVESQGRALCGYDGERVGLSQVEESLAIQEAPGGRGRSGLQAGQAFGDPAGVVINEGLDAPGGHVHWSTHRQAAVAVDHDGDGFTLRADYPVDGDGHAAIVTETFPNKL